MRHSWRAIAAALAALTLLLVPSVASADQGGSVLKVKMNDDCDPATWGATVCLKNGGTTPQELVAAVQKDGGDGAWWINPREHTIDKGDTIEVSDNGGLPHTFTEVKQYGGACFNTLAIFPGLPAFNDILGIQPVAECGNLGAVFASFVAPGSPTVTISNLSVGTHLFQCVFHPWMHSKIVVRDHA
jgi:plastocyanin